jgi:hypothetical protein
MYELQSSDVQDGRDLEVSLWTSPQSWPHPFLLLASSFFFYLSFVVVAAVVVIIDVCKNEIGNFSTVILERFEEE